MLGVFSDPYPDEIFYSICARICQHAGYSHHRIAMQDLFGLEATVASVSLPSHLDDFVSRLPPGNTYTSDYFIAEHTLLSFYSPFLAPEQHNRLRQDMRGQSGSAIHMRSGIMASRLPLPEWLRFCPQCVVEDKAKFGECYWHRVHQISGVLVCPSHGVLLCDSHIRVRNKKTRHKFISAAVALQEPDQHRSISHHPYPQILLELACDAYWLLHQHSLLHELPLLHSRYRKLLAEVDLATYRGRVNVNVFLQKFRNHYPSHLLKLLHCELEEHIQEPWLLRLVRSPDGAQHPLHHLLLIHFFGHSAESFFDLPTQYRPFGDEPWPCLNPICEHYRLLRIEKCQIDHSRNVGGKPIGTFECQCGFVYTRTGPDEGEVDKFRWSKVKSFGNRWESKLRELWEDEATSLRAIARQLSVDPLTIKRQANRIGLPFPRPVGRCFQLKASQKISLAPAQASKIAILKIKRTKWLAIMQAHLGAGVKILRSEEPGLYTWLYRNDKEWLQAHTPLYKKPEQRHYRVDWEARDLQLAEEVKIAALRLKNLPERPVRLTVSSIGRGVGQLALLQQHIDKLPKTADMLNEYVESREMFAVRRIQWVVKNYRQMGIFPEKWRLIKDAGVARLTKQPEVKSAINISMRILQQMWIECPDD